MLKKDEYVNDLLNISYRANNLMNNELIIGSKIIEMITLFYRGQV